MNKKITEEIMKETIKIDDFLKDVEKAFEYEEGLFFKKEVEKRYKCSKCGKHYSSGNNFCNDDGKEVLEYDYEYISEETKDARLRAFFDFDETPNPPQGNPFPYNFVQSLEKRGEGSGYYMNYIFERKSDGKYFYITIHFGDYRTEFDGSSLEETKKEVVTTWDFERYFA